jgi:PAS domain S-box-containing protein
MKSLETIHETVRGWARKWVEGCVSRVAPFATRDGRLFLYIAVIIAIALTASFFTIRGAEHRLLKNEAQNTAVHWARFLQSRLLALDEILAAGLVSEADRRIFDFASAAGDVRDYQVIRPDGIVAMSSWSGDFRGAIDPGTVLSVIREQHIVSQVVVDDMAGRALVIGQAYVPIQAESGQRGALKVDVDMTETAAHYRWLGNATFILLIALLTPPGCACGWLVRRNIRHRRQSELLQRQRGHILEDLAKGERLGSVLHGIAAFAEQHHPAGHCTILLLNPSGRRVIDVVGGSGDVDYKMLGRDLEQLPETLAGVLRGEISSAINRTGSRWVWTLPLRATTGAVQGAFSLAFSHIQEAHAAAALGPAPTLAQLAATAIEYRRAQNALTDMRKRQELILETAGDGIFGVNDNRQIVFANPACARMLCREPSEMIGMDSNGLFSTAEPEIETGALFPNPIAETLQNGVARRSDRIQLRRSDGIGFFAELTVTPVQQPTSNLRAVVVFHDISSQIQAQQQLFRAKEDAEMANRAKSGFLANMSHELRTPLNAIIGFSETIMQEVMGPVGNAHYREYAEHINLSGQHLLALINDLLDLSKIEAGKLELYETSFDIHAMLKESQMLVSDGVQDKQLVLDMNIAWDLATVHGDEQKLKQVVVNLLSNAVKFTKAGGRISVSASREGNDVLCLSVADTGIGIAPENMSKVMLPFGQADDAHSREQKGTGLGLPLSKSLVELHGGAFSLESTPGEGTTVSIRLPGRAQERASNPPTAANSS